MASTAPPHIPDHELLRRIGRGSYGEVWLARSVTGAYRAVKVIHRDSFDHERPYEREFTGIKKFEPISRDSETQVDILHVGRNDAEGFFYYVMELADDQKSGPQINPDDYTPRTLRNELYLRSRLPLPECLDIGVQLATALEHLHGSGLIHRDIKPSNIVFVNGTPKLADVGLVTTLDATRSFVGTEGYIPSDGPGTPQADLYSLGKVLYEISTGRDRLDFPELPTDLRDHPEREALVQLNEVVLKACHEDRKKRYQGAAEMLSDLRRLKAGKFHRRTWPARAWKVAASMVLLAVVLSLNWITGIKRSPSADKPPPLAQNSPTNVPNQTRDRAPDSQQPDLQAAASSGDPVPTSDPVAWWKADGNALDSAGTSHGKLREGVGFDVGRNGQAFSFNAPTACVSMYASNNPVWSFGSNDFCIALWANFSSSSASQAFLASEKGPGNPDNWVFCMHDGLLQWHMGQGIWLGSARFSPVVGHWYHLAITRSGFYFRMFVNGAEVSSDYWPGEVTRTVTTLTIGNAWGGRSFEGLLDDIRIYNRALAPDELKTLSRTESSRSEAFDDLIVIGPRKYQRREFKINTMYIAENAQVNLDRLANGDFLATWHQGGHWHCYGQVFNSEGISRKPAFLLNSGQLDETHWGPSPAPLPNGGFVVAYGTSGPVDSAAQRFDSNCAPVGAQFRLELPSGWPVVASYTNGDFIAAGTDAVGPRGDKDMPVYARRFNAVGSPYGSTFQVGTVTNGYGTPSSAYGTDGRFAFAWPSHTGNAMLRAYRSNEFSPFGVEFPANSIAAQKGMVSARYNSRNELFVVWFGSAGSSSNAVYVRRFDANMVAQGPERQVNETPTLRAWNTSLSIGTNNEALITWKSTQNNLYGRLLDGNGTALGHEFRVNQNPTGNHDSGWEACQHTAVLGNGNLVVGWVGDGASWHGLYLTLLTRLP